MEIPSYIEAADIIDKPLKHKWDDEEPDVNYASDSRTERAISAAANRAILTLSAASAEWIAWRLSGVADSTPLFGAIEAAYVGSCDWRYVRPLNRKGAPFPEEWHGPARGPICEAYFLIDRLLGDIEGGKYMCEHAAMLMKLTALVMPNSKAFKDWYKKVLARLVEQHPKSTSDQAGSPVPREACDPVFDYQAQDARKLLKAFLSGLDPKKNKLLATPAQMKKAGFEGTPYKL